MDDLEYADKQYQTHFEARVKAIRAEKIKLHNPSQKCWSCEADTESDRHRWCSSECRDRYQKENE